MTWTTKDYVALYLSPLKNNTVRVDLVRKHDTFESASPHIGAMEGLDEAERDRILQEAAASNISIIGWADDEYPSRLRSIPAAPLMLFVRGKLPEEAAPTIAVVGTRTCTTQFGKPATDLLVSAWAKAGAVIVSGLAHGIDTLAHEACLRAGGTTVAVIASGMNRIMPRSARDLADRIVAEGGAVVTEFASHLAALPSSFPARNRIISGLSDAVVVVESKRKGGALITAEFALKHGRPLWAVPGPITSSRSIGTNTLISQGEARLLSSPEPLLASLGVTNTSHVSRDLPQELTVLGPDPLSAEDVAQRWNCDISETLQRLLEFEFSGLVKQLPGSRFVVEA
jgi:DNA processing protein